MENQENTSVNLSNKQGSTGDLKPNTESNKNLKQVKEGYIPYGEALLYDFKPTMFAKLDAEQRVL